jgi:hypothetical protein
MYSNNFAAAIKVNGKILREFGDTVYLPFGSEYEIRLKNLDLNRAKVNIQIDGETVTSNDIILEPNETFDLERFIRYGNLQEGNKFKFIERTSKIEQHRGVKLEDGLITITYEFEIPKPVMAYPLNTTIYRSSSKGYTSGNTFASVSLNSVKVSNDTGITVEGSKSNQPFSTTYWNGSSGHKGILNIKLLGETENNKVIREPVTVKTKLECKTCGTNNHVKSKFCSECGTALEII